MRGCLVNVFIDGQRNITTSTFKVAPLIVGLDVAAVEVEDEDELMLIVVVFEDALMVVNYQYLSTTSTCTNCR